MGAKGEQTRERIVRRAATVFNRQGFEGSSLADIMAVTGLRKGGIYRHFESKETLAVAAYGYAVEQVAGRFRRALEGVSHAVDRLSAVVRVFAGLAEDPPVPGGCPIVNCAVESDDGSPVLRAGARASMDRLLGMVRGIVQKGVDRGELRADAEVDAVATLLVGALEGALVLSNLYRDAAHMRRTVTQLEHYIERELRA